MIYPFIIPDSATGGVSAAISGPSGPCGGFEMKRVALLSLLLLAVDATPVLKRVMSMLESMKESSEKEKHEEEKPPGSRFANGIGRLEPRNGRTTPEIAPKSIENQ